MSSQRGNTSRTRPQKYKNNKAFKNDLHDTSLRTKQINSVSLGGLCHRCKDKIDWKIKYKKYKPLSQPSTCVRCNGKTVKKAYYTVCQPCASQAGVCAKCNTKQDIVLQPEAGEQEKAAQEGQLKFELKQLTERQRRSFFRHVEKGDVEGAEVLKASARFQDEDISEDDDDSDFADNDSDVLEESTGVS